MITIQKYIEELNGRGRPISHGFEFTYADDRQNTRHGTLTFTQRKFEEERKSADTTLIQFFEREAKKNFNIPSDQASSTVEYKTTAEIRTKLGDNIIET